jgi:hypothetical protein
MKGTLIFAVCAALSIINPNFSQADIRTDNRQEDPRDNHQEDPLGTRQKLSRGSPSIRLKIVKGISEACEIFRFFRIPNSQITDVCMLEYIQESGID